jgi:hypothetical protein
MDGWITLENVAQFPEPDFLCRRYTRTAWTYIENFGCWVEVQWEQAEPGPAFRGNLHFYIEWCIVVFFFIVAYLLTFINNLKKIGDLKRWDNRLKSKLALSEWYTCFRGVIRAGIDHSICCLREIAAISSIRQANVRTPTGRSDANLGWRLPLAHPIRRGNNWSAYSCTHPCG